VSRQIRHQVYNSIVQRLADYGWHDVGELDQVTTYPHLWLDSLRRDPRFDVDDGLGRVRLLPSTNGLGATT
jgi:hypothetical protein